MDHLRNGEKSVNPLRDEASPHLQSGNQKKETRFAGLFFLTSLPPMLAGLQPVLPLGQCSPSKSVTLHRKCLQKSAPSPLVSACRQVTTQPLDRRGILGMVSVYRTCVHYSLCIQTPLDRQGMASLQSNCTFSFKHHLTGEPVLPLSQCPPSKRYTL